MLDTNLSGVTPSNRDATRADFESTSTAVGGGGAVTPGAASESGPADLPWLQGLKSRRPAQTNLYCLVAGVVLAAVTTLAVSQWAPAGGVLQRMFDLSRAETLIPIAATALFFYAMALLAVRGRVVGALQRVATREIAVQLASSIRELGLARMSAQLEAPRLEGNPLVRSTRAVLEQWQLQPGRGEAELALKAQTEADREATQSVYAWIGTIVWTLPVIGLMAAVLGISVSVEGFSTFLGSDIDNIRTVKSALVHVTGGLGFAFMLTLLGLATAVIVMFRSASVQAREERFHADLQQWLTDIVLPAVQQTEPVDHGVVAPSHVEQLLQIAGEGLQAATKEVIESVRQALVAERSATQELCADVQRAVVGTGVSTADALRQAGGEVATAIVAAGDRTAVRLEQAAQAAADLCTAVEAMDRTQAERDTAMLTSARSVEEALAKVSGDVREAAATMRAAAIDAREAISALRNAGIGPALEAVSKRLDVQAKETSVAATQIAQLVDGTRQLATSQAELLQGIAAMEEMGLSRALTGLDATLGRIGPVLEHFQQPLVLKFAPVNGSGGHAA